MTSVLVIEDNDVIRNEIVTILEFEHFDVRTARNGQEGLVRIAEVLPDVIVCDVTMPGVDGYAVLTHVRTHSASLAVPFVLLTARAHRGSVRKGMELGADDYLVKPFGAEELVGAIRAALARRRASTLRP